MKQSQHSLRIAEEAARLLARDEAPSIDAARRKAARRLGFNDRAQLPSDAEVSAALGAYRGLFQAPSGSTHARRLAVAAEAMAFMGMFHPELAEPLSASLALPNTPIRILLYSEDPDAPLHHLMDAGLVHMSVRERLWETSNDAAHPVDVLQVIADDQAVGFWPLPERLRGRPLKDSPLGTAVPRFRLSAVRAASKA